jgi:hypothetical protein
MMADVGKKASNQIVCDYVVTISPSDFFSRNYYVIQQNCAARIRSFQPLKAL